MGEVRERFPLFPLGIVLLPTELVPLQIAYTTGFNKERALRSVDFFYETAHNEPSCRYVAGFGIGSQQRLTRIEESGAREEFVRVPIELLIEEPAD